MKCKDLIKQLKEFNLDADISLTSSEDICLSYICKDLQGNELSKADTKMVFIEPIDKYFGDDDV